MKDKPRRRSPGTLGTAPTEAAEAGKERVAKVMARAGLCSRRDAEGWIAEGRVAVNGTVITSPALNIGPEDRVAVDGREIGARERTRLFLYHKPRGLVTTAKDPEGRPTVFDHLPEGLPRVVSVGRLDINTEGLLLLTNDGGLARVLELPSTGWLRRYRVRANGMIGQERLDALKEGITVDGVDYAGIEATLDRSQGANVWLTLGLREGKNREIKRVLEHLGLFVNRLIRVSYGPFQLGEIAEGAAEEIRTRVLRDQLGPDLAAQAGVDWEDEVTAAVVTRDVKAERAAKQQMERLTRDAARAPRAPMPAGRDPARTGRDPARTGGTLRSGGGASATEQRPRVDRPKPNARPHVSALRAERPAASDEPRKRIERKETEDRKGRTVKVERVTVAKPTRHTGEGGTSRNARNFARERFEARAEESDAQPPRSRRNVSRGGFGSERPATGRALKEAKSRGGERRGADRPERGERPPRSDNKPRSASGSRSSDAPRSGDAPRSWAASRPGSKPGGGGPSRSGGGPSRSGGAPRSGGPSRSGGAPKSGGPRPGAPGGPRGRR